MDTQYLDGIWYHQMKLTSKNLLSIGYFATMLTLTLTRVLFSTDIVTIERNSLFTVIAQLVAMGVVPIIFTVLSSKRQTDREYVSSIVRIGRKTSAKVWIAVLALGVVQLMLNGIFSSAWQNLLKMIGFTQSHGDPTTYDTTSALVLGILMTGILPAIFEEITHRGMLLSAVDDGNSFKAIALSSIAFALMHQNVLQQAHTLVGGIVFGMVALFTGNILCSMLLHAINNIWVVLTTYASTHGGIFGDIQNFLIEFYFGAELWLKVLLTVVVVVIGLGAGVYIYKHRVERKPQLNTPPDTIDKVSYISAILLGLGGVVMTFVWGLMR